MTWAHILLHNESEVRQELRGGAMEGCDIPGRLQRRRPPLEHTTTWARPAPGMVP